MLFFQWLIQGFYSLLRRIQYNYNIQSQVTDTAVDLLCFLHFPRAVFWCIQRPGSFFSTVRCKLDCLFQFEVRPVPLYFDNAYFILVITMDFNWLVLSFAKEAACLIKDIKAYDTALVDQLFTQRTLGVLCD